MKNNKILKYIFFYCVVLLLLSNKTLAEIPIYQIEGKKITYTKNGFIITAEGNAEATDSKQKKIFADKIIYDKSQNIITTSKNSLFKDEKGNSLYADNFSYNLNSKIIEAFKNVKYLSKNGDAFYFDNLKYYEEYEKGIGKKLKARLLDKTLIDGDIAEFDNKAETLTIGTDTQSFFKNFLNLFKKTNTNYYTPCKNEESQIKSIKEICPDWSLTSQKTLHDKKNQMIYHYGSILKIKDIPIFYTPYFSHPDPSVKRKSGFLPPSIKNFTNLGQTIKTPYHWVIDTSKDLTFTPIYYFDERPIFLAEYRQQNYRSKFYIDASYTEGYKNLNKLDENGNSIERTSGGRNHFFLNFLGSYDDLLLARNDLEINIQRISQKNYLEVNQINTQYIKQDIKSLNNNIILNSYEMNKKISTNFNIFENLEVENRNQKYQYTLPSIEYSDFFKKYDQYINFNSLFSNKNLGGDSQQIYFINKLDSESETNILSAFDGVSNKVKISLNNINFYNENVIGSKENMDNNLYLTTAIENSYPLYRKNTKENEEETIVPKVLTKLIVGSNSNSTNQNDVRTFDQIYAMNRLNNNTEPETGTTFGYGVEYNLSKKNKNNEVFVKSDYFIGQVIKPGGLNNDKKTALSDTASNFVGGYKYTRFFNSDDHLYEKKSDSIEINYDYILSNDVNKILKNSINTNINYKNNSIKAIYYETHDISNEHYLDLKISKKLENNFNIGIGGRKNIQDSFTESNYIEANYDSDCLKIALNLSKRFFQNEEVKPSNNLTLQIIFKPFGSPISPDLSSFIN